MMHKEKAKMKIKNNKIKKIEKALEVLKNSNLKNKSLLIEGPAGVGKSYSVKEWALKNGYNVLDIRLINYSPGDLVLKVPEDRNRVLKNYYTYWLKEIEKNPKTVLLLDEIDKAPPEIQRLAYQIILDRELEGLKIPEEVIIVAIQNLEEEGTFNNIKNEKPLYDRFTLRVKIKWGPELEEGFLKFAKEKLDNRIYRFLKLNRDLIRVETEEELIVTPRRWEMLSHLIKEKESLEEIKEIVTLVVNEEIAESFVSFLRIEKEIDIEKIKKEPEYLEENRDKLINMILLASKKFSKPEDFENLIKFLLENNKELLIYLLKEIEDEDLLLELLDRFPTLEDLIIQI